MSNFLLRKIKRYLPQDLYKIIRLPYRIVFIATKYSFTHFGFKKNLILEINDAFFKKTFVIKYKKLKFYNKGWDVFREKNGYEKLTNLKNILDLGGFIGDSAIMLAAQNDKIYLFEPEREKFKWILKNIKLNNYEKKVKPYNYAAVSNTSKTIEFNKSGDFGAGSSIHKNSELLQVETVKCMNINKIMDLAHFDGFKCDIEGGEFSLIKFFLEYPNKFTFKKGIIEWHFTKGDKKQKQILLQFLKYLEKSNYNFYFHPQNNPSKILNTKSEIQKIVKETFENDIYANMFYFEKNK